MKLPVAEREFDKLKKQVSNIANIIKHSKLNSLWEHDKTLRDKIIFLKEIKVAIKKSKNNKKVMDVENTIETFEELLDEVSDRLLDDYNKKNHTNFSLKEIKERDYGSYLNSGIINVLVTIYIPKIIGEKLDIILPSNPKNEYKDARKLKRKFILHLGETNTGKTYNAMERLKLCNKGVYLAPLRILALENYEKLNRDGVKCSLLTGEEEIVKSDDTHISCTIEKLNLDIDYEVAVIDEIQMIGDSQRGAAWTRAMLGLKCNEIHVCGAINTKELLIKILDDTGDEYEIKEYIRDTPLSVQEKQFKLKDISSGDALIAFSKKKVLELAEEYAKRGIRASVIYGDLPPEVRRMQYEEFLQGKNHILITTDAIGMGVNLPIKRIVFMYLEKFDGKSVRYLKSQEVKQIAGRAGRKGIYPIGYVATHTNEVEFLKEMIEKEDPKIKKAILGPSEDILTIENATLREKLSLWIERPCDIDLYKKMDIKEFLIKLHSIESYKLSQEIQWKLMRIPFDPENIELLNIFLSYVDEVFICKSKTISKPTYSIGELVELELYYQKINMYYSFSKTLSLSFDEAWVYRERAKVSTMINALLLNLSDVYPL